MRQIFLLGFALFVFTGCGKNDSDMPSDPDPVPFSYKQITVDGRFTGLDYKGTSRTPAVKVTFGAPLDQGTIATSITLKDKNASTLSFTFLSSNNDSTIVIKPLFPLTPFTAYELKFSGGLKSKAGGTFNSPFQLSLTTGIDSTDKFPRISRDSLLTLIQKQTFRYFYNLGHPVSGMARERNTSGDIVTTGGTGFGLMAIPVAIERKFITRQEGFNRVETIVNFLTTKAASFHGAYPHWLNGFTGMVVPFSEKDNGADLVETSFLMMGLITARQYFNEINIAETKLREDINQLWKKVEWDWFRRNGGNVLYWHWSPNYEWAMNMAIQGWNECLITYVLAASGNDYTIPKSVYDIGFARNGAIKNNISYYGTELPLGEPFGGPLFFSHYSFLGLNPNGLSDSYADYRKQVVNHSKINYEYCKANPLNNYGYSQFCWGLTASDIKDGYTASSPTNDVGVIAPTAAISSIPFTPNESMQAIEFFYYQLGDKIWGQYGFIDAFSLNEPWFANSYLAIDQGPQIVMIENYRTGLVWNLFMSAPEIKNGLTRLGFSFNP